MSSELTDEAVRQLIDAQNMILTLEEENAKLREAVAQAKVFLADMVHRAAEQESRIDRLVTVLMTTGSPR